MSGRAVLARFRGPACYAQGGVDATLTDANVVLGYLDDERLPSGLRLDGDLARRAVADHVAAPLGLDAARTPRTARSCSAAREWRVPSAR